MKLTEVYQAIGIQMLSDFEHIHTQIKHMGERGGEREAGLRAFLGTYLPSRYAVSNGEIVDKLLDLLNGKSLQCQPT